MHFRSARFYQVLLCLLLGSITLLLTTCGERKRDDAASVGGDEKKALTRVVILVDGYFTSLRLYQVAWLEKFVRSRPGVELVIADANGDAEIQAKQIESAATQATKVIFIFPVKAELVNEAMHKAKLDGSYVLAFAGNLPDEAFSSAVYTDEKLIGRLAGEHVIAALTKKASDEGFSAVLGRVVELRGEEKTGVSVDMADGFKEALSKAPGITIVHDAPAWWNVQDAQDRMREAVRLQKSFHVVFAHDDLMAYGASLVMKETDARDSVLIMGVGGMFGPEGGLQRVQDGILDATIFYPPLVDVAWKQVRQILTDPTAKMPKRSLVKPYIIDYSKAVEINQKGLPAPVIEK